MSTIEQPTIAHVRKLSRVESETVRKPRLRLTSSFSHAIHSPRLFFFLSAGTSLAASLIRNQPMSGGKNGSRNPERPVR
jgi:hypothetical protein